MEHNESLFSTSMADFAMIDDAILKFKQNFSYYGIFRFFCYEDFGI